MIGSHNCALGCVCYCAVGTLGKIRSSQIHTTCGTALQRSHWNAQPATLVSIHSSAVNLSSSLAALLLGHHNHCHYVYAEEFYNNTAVNFSRGLSGCLETINPETSSKHIIQPFLFDNKQTDIFGWHRDQQSAKAWNRKSQHWPQQTLLWPP